MMRRRFSTDRPILWMRLIGAVAAIVLGFVLLLASWGKVLDPETFVDQIRIEGLDVFGLAGPVAYFALVIEIALGTALLLAIRRSWILIPTLLLVLFFLFLTGRAYWRFEHGLIGADESCGCFGNLFTRTPAEAFWQDLVLLALPAVLTFVGLSRTRRPFPTKRVIAAAVVTAAGLLLALVSPDLPLDDWATRLRPGVAVAELCAGPEGSADRVCLDTLISDLDVGRHWVVISNLDEPRFLEALPRLNRWALSDGGILLWVVTGAGAEAVATFAWTQAPAFEVREAPVAMLRPLHRRLPRSFLVESGEVVETRPGLPPGAF